MGRKNIEQEIHVEFWVVQCWRFCYSLLDTVKHVLFLLSPIVDCVLLDQLLDGFDNLLIIRDELSEEVDLPPERLHGFLVHEVRNLCDGPNYF